MSSFVKSIKCVYCGTASEGEEGKCRCGVGDCSGGPEGSATGASWCIPKGTSPDSQKARRQFLNAAGLRPDTITRYMRLQEARDEHGDVVVMKNGQAVMEYAVRTTLGLCGESLAVTDCPFTDNNTTVR
mgnify:CR=1 FL=1